MTAIKIAATSILTLGVITAGVIQASDIPVSANPNDGVYRLSAYTGQEPITLTPPDVTGGGGRWQVTGWHDDNVARILKDDECMGHRCIVVQPAAVGNTTLHLQYRAGNEIL